jgi:DNA-binding transcriptional ArsR family regulator
MKTDSELASLFAALAHPSRIAVLRVLLTHGQSGRQFGDLSKDLGTSPSTLTHHLHEMESAGVLSREAVGRVTKLRLNLSSLAESVAELTRLCCSIEVSPLPHDEDHSA